MGKKQLFGEARFVSLRYRFIFITSVMLLLLLVALALILVMLQTRTIRGRIEKQGLAIAKNLAAISVDSLVTYNYVALEKLANQAVNNPDILYVIIHDKEGRVAGYSKRPDLQNKILTDNHSINVTKVIEPLVSIYIPEFETNKIMEIVVPVYLSDSPERWGIVRVRLSLELMYQQIRQTYLSIFILGSIALTIGILISDWAAQRVTKPLDTLVKASIEVAKGNLEQNIAINTNDEVQILASNFSFMIEEILSQKQKLENQLIEIKQLQQYTEKILDTMNDGLLIIDMDGNINTANPAACSILGVPDNQQLEDNHVLKCFNKELSFTNYIQKSLENPSGRNQHEINIKTGEGARTILAGASLLESDQKIPKQIIFNLNDISNFKKLEAEIRQTQRLADLGIFAAGMAHEIRNPLSAIKTYVALLPKKIDNPGFLEKFQRTVPREINRLNIFIEELLELSREPKYNFKLTDIQKLILHCTELVEADFQTKNIDCKFDDLNDLPSVMADADQLEKIFINLMLNAAQAMPNGGVLTINTLSNENMVIIDFKDTGLGFSSEVAENIFNPFFTTKAKGTGLGLAISHKVISEHGGNIKAESELEKGSCFSVRLPIERQ